MKRVVPPSHASAHAEAHAVSGATPVVKLTSRIVRPISKPSTKLPPGLSNNTAPRSTDRAMSPKRAASPSTISPWITMSSIDVLVGTIRMSAAIASVAIEVIDTAKVTRKEATARQRKIIGERYLGYWSFSTVTLASTKKVQVTLSTSSKNPAALSVGQLKKLICTRQGISQRCCVTYCRGWQGLFSSG